MTKRSFLYLLIISFLSILIFFVAAELTCRILEPGTAASHAIKNVPDPVLGWVPQPGKQHLKTSEYDVVYDINSLGMNDRPVNRPGCHPALKILVLGDSHTFATGVSQEEAWPRLLESRLFKGDCNNGVVYNCAVIGYGLGQYYLRMKQMEDVLQPDIILIGFSMATDLYDLLPPRMGGFIYGGDQARAYFDLDQEGNLYRAVYAPVKNPPVPAGPGFRANALLPRLRMEDFALYRRLKTSFLAAWLGMRMSDEHLFLGSDIAFKKIVGSREIYCWQLTEKLLARFAYEAGTRNRKVILVNIPYLAQVYDQVWKSSYGSMPDKYDRWIGERRLRDVCQRVQIGFIDTTPGFVKKARSGKTRLHYKLDKHPTAEGHKIIADSVAEYLEAELKKP